MVWIRMNGNQLNITQTILSILCAVMHLYHFDDREIYSFNGIGMIAYDRDEVTEEMLQQLRYWSN